MSRATTTDEYECRASGCQRSFDTYQGRNVHEGTQHDFETEIGVLAHKGVRSHLDSGEQVVVTDSTNNVRNYHTTDCGNQPVEHKRVRIGKDVAIDAGITECSACRARKQKVSGERNRPQETTATDTRYARHHADLILSLPEPGEEYELRDIDIDKDTWSSISQRDIVKKVVPHQRRMGNRCSIWKTNKAYYEEAKAHKERTDAMLPCGHNGFENPRGIDGLRCKTCGDVFEKDEIR